MANCPICGRDVSPEWRNCPYCGALLVQMPSKPPAERKRSRRKVIGVIVGLSGLLGAGYVAYRYYGDEIAAIIKRMAGEAGQATTVTKTDTVTTSGAPSPLTTGTTSSPTIHPATSETTTTSPHITTTTATTATSETSITITRTTATLTTIPEFPERVWDRMAYPYISVGGQAMGDDVQVSVTNEGDAPSFYTVLEFYQGPIPNSYPELKLIEHPLNSFKLAWRRITSLAPGQRLNFDLSGVTPRYEVLVWVCYDPLIDPRRFRMDSDAELRSIFRSSLDRERHVMVMGRSGLLEG